ncbi:MAG: hypothetical protein WCW87_02775 [Candidatus Paceibacterota bacterium]
MNKKSITISSVAIVIIIVFSVVIYFYLVNKNNIKTNIEQNADKAASESAKVITDSASKGVLPSVTTNPLENKPDINPVDKANPFKDVKTNPFE